MTNALTSLHGRKAGLDNAGNLVLNPNDVGQRIAASAFFETGSTAARFKPYGTTIFGATAAKTFTLDGPNMDIGSVKYLRNKGASTTIQKVNSGSTSITFDGTLRNLAFNGADDAVVLVKESATRIAVYANVGSVVASS